MPYRPILPICCLLSLAMSLRASDALADWAAATPATHDDYMLVPAPYGRVHDLLYWEPLAAVLGQMPFFGGRSMVDKARAALDAGKDNWPTCVAMSADSGSYRGGGALLSCFFLLAWAEGFEGLGDEEQAEARPHFDALVQTLLGSSAIPDCQLWVGLRSAAEGRELLQSAVTMLTMFAQERDVGDWPGAGRARFVLHGSALLAQSGFDDLDLRAMLVDLGIVDNIADGRCDDIITAIGQLRLPIELRVTETGASLRLGGPPEADALGNDGLAGLVVRDQDVCLLAFDSKAVLDSFAPLQAFEQAVAGTRFEALALERDADDIIGSWRRNQRQYFSLAEDRMELVIEMDGDLVVRSELIGAADVESLRTAGFDRFLPPQDGRHHLWYADLTMNAGDLLAEMTSNLDEKLVERHEAELQRRILQGEVAASDPTMLDIFRGRFGKLRRLLLDGAPGVFARGWMMVGRCSASSAPLVCRSLDGGSSLRLDGIRLPEVALIARLDDGSTVIERISQLLEAGGLPRLQALELPDVGAAWAFPLGLDGQALVDTVPGLLQPHVLVVDDGHLLISTSPELSRDLLADHRRPAMPEGPVYVWGSAGEAFMNDARTMLDDWQVATDPQGTRLHILRGEAEHPQAATLKTAVSSGYAGARWVVQFGFLCRELSVLTRAKDDGWQGELRLSPVSQPLPEMPLPAHIKALINMAPQAPFQRAFGNRRGGGKPVTVP